MKPWSKLKSLLMKAAVLGADFARNFAPGDVWKYVETSLIPRDYYFLRSLDLMNVLRVGYVSGCVLILL